MKKSEWWRESWLGLGISLNLGFESGVFTVIDVYMHITLSKLGLGLGLGVRLWLALELGSVS